MSEEETEINQLTPWSASTMALLCIQGVKFTLTADPGLHQWIARWQAPGEASKRTLVEHSLWKLVHRVALAYGRTGKGDY